MATNQCRTMAHFVCCIIFSSQETVTTMKGPSKPKTPGLFPMRYQNGDLRNKAVVGVGVRNIMSKVMPAVRLMLINVRKFLDMGT